MEVGLDAWIFSFSFYSFLFLTNTQQSANRRAGVTAARQLFNVRFCRHTSTDPTLRSKSTYRCVFNALNWPGIGPHGIQNLSLLDYLRQQNWTTRPIAHGSEFVGFCPLYPDTGPSFYVDSSKNLFYCHGWSQGRDLLRFVQVSHHLSFRHSLAYLQQQSDPPADPAPAGQPKTVPKVPASIRSQSLSLPVF